MKKTIYWDKFRILVTNKCNYKCSFCHNEGQIKSKKTINMTFYGFKNLIDTIKEEKISELCFSGGEPFLNKNIIEMIKYANDNTSFDLACATNFSLITKEQMKILSNTRIKFNIQFPFTDDKKFKKSTGTGNLLKIKNNIKEAKKLGLKIGLNSVIQKLNKKQITDIILFALHNKIPLKLLPIIGNKESKNFKNFVYPILENYSIDCYDKKTGAVRWTLSDSKHKTTILYIDSPCFYKNINICKKYSEIRVLPDMKIQTCILKKAIDKLDFAKGQKFVLEQLRKAWKNYKSC